MRALLLLGIGFGMVQAAAGGSVIGSGSETLWGNTYSTTAWDVSTDAATIGGDFFQPEGMTYYNGTLYVTGDADETDPALVAYSTGGTGSLATANGIQMAPANNGSGADRWGPEGITVNTSGSGYGAGAGQLVSVESGSETDVYEGYTATIDTTGAAPVAVGNLDQPFPTFDPDDISFVASEDRFAVINDPSRIDFLDDGATLTASARASFFPFGGVGVGDAKGLATISKAFADALTGGNSGTSEALIVVYESNDIAVWDLDGTQIGSTENLANLLSSSNAVEPAEVESIAVDEANGLIFIGDEKGLAITTIVIPEPSTGLLLLGLLGFVRRR